MASNLKPKRLMLCQREQFCLKFIKLADISSCKLQCEVYFEKDCSDT